MTYASDHCGNASGHFGNASSPKSRKRSSAISHHAMWLRKSHFSSSASASHIDVTSSLHAICYMGFGTSTHSLRVDARNPVIVLQWNALLATSHGRAAYIPCTNSVLDTVIVSASCASLGTIRWFSKLFSSYPNRTFAS